MFTLIYSLGMHIYGCCIALAAKLGHKKAQLLYKGRKETWQKVEQYDNSKSCIWIHAASLGEFEQGRPIIEAIKAQYPDEKIVLTFYSPSGYEVRKNYKEVDMVCYMPLDTRGKAKKFIEAINPKMAFFVKYEFWHHFINTLNKKQIPLYGVSMIFRETQPFFKSWGGWFRDMLKKFTYIYVQDQKSSELLKSIGVEKHVVAGDTRFDRVKRIAEQPADFPVVERFCKDADYVIVMGSAWPPDDAVVFPFINNSNKNVKLIIAPHEIHAERIKSITDALKVPYTLYTEAGKLPADGTTVEESKVLVINTIGMLSAIYRFGQVAYVGGGFGVGIHNTIEAATYGMPVLFGPNYKRFKEACDLIECGGGSCVNSEAETTALLTKFMTDGAALKEASEKADTYVKSMCGATEKIMDDYRKGIFN